MSRPKCCNDCIHLDSTWSEYSDITGYYCLLNIMFPTKKKKCKKQRFKKPVGKGDETLK